MSEDSPKASPAPAVLPSVDVAKRIGARLIPIFRDPVLRPKAEPLTVAAAALVAALVVFEQGAGAAESMAPADALTFAKALRGQRPIAWAAALRENAHGFAHALEAHAAPVAKDATPTESPERFAELAALLKP